MVEHLRVTVRSQPQETESAFQARLAGFWTRMLRTRPDDYEKVYAEMSHFERDGDVLTRQYQLEVAVTATLTDELTAEKLDFDPVDEDEIYSKYEAAPPEWFWIEH